MKWLIWKEFRLNWPILAIAVLFLVVPYIVAGCMLLMNRSAEGVTEVLEGGWMTNLLVSTVILALLGGQSIACERADRSAEFLAYQPVPRGRIVLSKLVWPSVSLAIIFGLNSTLLLAAKATQLGSIQFDRATDILLGFTPFLAAALCAFAIAWGISALQNSPTYAVMTGIAVPIVGLWLVELTNCLPGFLTTNLQKLIVYLAVYLSLSLISFIGGTWYYLRRVEP